MKTILLISIVFSGFAALADSQTVVNHIRSTDKLDNRVVRVTITGDPEKGENLIYKFEYCESLSSDAECSRVGTQETYSLETLTQMRRIKRMSAAWSNTLDVGILAGFVLSGFFVGAAVAGSGGLLIGAGVGLAGAGLSIVTVDRLSPMKRWREANHISAGTLEHLQMTDLLIDSGIAEFAGTLDKILSE